MCIDECVEVFFLFLFGRESENARFYRGRKIGFVRKVTDQIQKSQTEREEELLE